MLWTPQKALKDCDKWIAVWHDRLSKTNDPEWIAILNSHIARVDRLRDKLIAKIAAKQ